MMRISGKEGRPYTILFRGCSFLIIYEAGVLAALRELSPDILKSASRIYGSSSGSIIATTGLCESDIEEVRDTILSRLKTCFLGLVPGKRAHKVLRYGLEKHLPPNAHELVSGKLHVVLTRVHDWKSVTVSEFASKEDLIQAILCSCFIPGYFGFFPPKYRGVRYMDGELAMWRADFVSQNTITVSAFAGEYDICPRDGSAAFFNFQLSDCTLHLSMRNLCRLQHLFQVPKRQVMDRFFASGYQDTVCFLKRLIDFPVDYFEGFTLSFTNGSCQKGEETLHLKPEMRELYSRATDPEEVTEENGGTTQAEDEEEAPHHLRHPQKAGLQHFSPKSGYLWEESKLLCQAREQPRGPGQPQKSISGLAAAFGSSLSFKERMSNLQPHLKAEPDLH